MSVLLVNANALSIPLADESVHCVVTSPPYWGLRDYGIGGQLGLEQTPEQYVKNMVSVFREVWRVLRDDGACWLNLGDSYAGSGGAGGDYNPGGLRDGQPRYDGTAKIVKSKRMERGSGRWGGGNSPASGALKPKDLVGIPWRVAFALQADGWYLRSEIIWSKPNPMPESVTDRPTKSHEYLFLLTKQPRYFYDQDAIMEPVSPNTHMRVSQDVANQIGSFRANGGAKTNGPMKAVIRTPKQAEAGSGIKNNDSFNDATCPPVSKRNKRTVWEIPTHSFSGAHFATFPPALVEPCIKAGASQHGVCSECGAPWKRVVEKPKPPKEVFTKTRKPKDGYVLGFNNDGEWVGSGQKLQNWLNENPAQTTGWQPTCPHADAPVVPATVLDPFAGSGTTLLVARQLGRHAVGLDLSFGYLHEQARHRLQMDALDAWGQGKQDGASVDDLPLFAYTEDK